MIVTIRCTAKPGEGAWEYVFACTAALSDVKPEDQATLCHFKIPIDGRLSKRALVEHALETMGSPNEVERIELSSEVQQLVIGWRELEYYHVLIRKDGLKKCIDWDLFEEEYG